MTSWILILLTFLPFLAAIIAYMLGRRDERAMNGFVSITCPGSRTLTRLGASSKDERREQVVVVLNSLRELPELIRTMPEEDYQRYAANGRRVGARLRAGENTKRALRRLEEVE